MSHTVAIVNRKSKNDLNSEGATVNRSSTNDLNNEDATEYLNKYLH